MALHFSVSDVVANVEFDREIVLADGRTVRKALALATQIQEPDKSKDVYLHTVLSFHLISDEVQWDLGDYTKLTEDEFDMVFTALDESMDKLL